MPKEKEGVKPGAVTTTEEPPPQEETEEKPVETTEEEETTSTEEEPGQPSSETSETEEGSEETSEEDPGKTKTVPYGRFKEVNDELKELRTEVKQLRIQQTESNKPKTWDSVPLEQLKSLRRKYIDEGNTEMQEFVEEKILDRKVDEKADRKLGVLEFNRIRKESWSETVGQYKGLADSAFDLSNENSELYRRTVKLCDSDPRFDRVAEGHSLAARLVAGDMLRERLTKSKSNEKVLKKKVLKNDQRNSLEKGGRPQAGTTPSGDLAKLLKAAEDSGNPYGPEWRTYLTALDKKDKANKKGE